MKILMMSAAFTGLLTTTAMAGNFDDNIVDLTITSGNLEFTASTVQGDVAGFATGLTVAEYQLGEALTAGVFASIGYDILADDITVYGEYSLATTVNDKIDVYGLAGLGYVAPTNALREGDFVFTPAVGGTYNINAITDAFAEVGYGLNLSGSNDAGAYAEVGANVYVNDFILTPSIVHSFGGDTNAKLEVTFQF